MKTNNNIVKLISVLVIGGFLGFVFSFYFFPRETHFEQKLLGDQRDEFLLEKEHMMSGMIAHGDYACCLEKPCTYCIEKTPGHGEGATCTCLEDVINGVHPCGECIGEILEGHGNRFLAEYFAVSIAEEVGEEHLDSLREIVSSKYEISIEEQI